MTNQEKIYQDYETEKREFWKNARLMGEGAQFADKLLNDFEERFPAPEKPIDIIEIIESAEFIRILTHRMLDYDVYTYAHQSVQGLSLKGIEAMKEAIKDALKYQLEDNKE